MQSTNAKASTPVDEILLPAQAAAFLGVTEEQLHNAVCQGYLPGACIDGQWRFSKRGLSKFCWQRNNHNGSAPWLENSCGPYWLGDWAEQKAKGVIEAYEAGERYFPGLSIKGGRFDGQDLSGIDFWESGLKGASFSGCILKQAIFVGADLTSAVFRNADLSDANLEGAVVEDADFSGAILNRTNFAVSLMSGAKLDGVSISMVSF
ncbi:Pentapeptide repeat protein MfpA [Acaryochloris thomasi RCC1774]|uniref:Pentapeptide repeat protein MfpA n=1 Tax=Acaryochloris thomasi RCC1774 TaxID=1764569 RepID=A0A2W1J847_9CYAN|nr:pentapeptide repeat-containing protein [Acaryochloris thomasi]PZD70599.1 Pentapeptide repeat protein MfpA [Acaryochloris thomasi RCC1774]